MHDYFCTLLFIIGVSIFVPPKITEHPQNLNLKLYERATLLCKATGNPQPRILWFKNGDSLKNDNSDQSELEFRYVELEDRGFYHCEARSIINGQNVSDRADQVIVYIEGIRLYRNMHK